MTQLPMRRRAVRAAALALATVAAATPATAAAAAATPATAAPQPPYALSLDGAA